MRFLTNLALYAAVALGVLASFLPLIIWKAYVASILWRWFIVPLGSAVPELTTLQMSGVLIVVIALVSPLAKGLKEEPPSLQELVRYYLIAVAMPLINLTVGAMFKFFWM